MAEAALYDNLEEPTFPYEAVAEHLAFLPTYIEELTPLKGRNSIHETVYDSLINLILVFGRARTSMYDTLATFDVTRNLMLRLNDILTSVGAKEHHLEQVRRCNSCYFVTTTHSPRFNWKQQLTHREIGMNLDMFAAGHLCVDRETRHVSYLVETSGHTLRSVYAEVVDVHLIPDFGEFEAFSRRKEALYNETMAKLRLPYRFKWFWQEPDTMTKVQETLHNDVPPSATWWSDNYFFVNGFYIQGAKHLAMSFCGQDTKFDEYWPVIQRMYAWMVKYRKLHVMETRVRYWEEMETIMKICRSVTSASRSSSDNELSPEKRMIRLLEEFETNEESYAEEEGIRDYPKRYKRFLDTDEPECVRFFRRLFEKTKIYTVQRWKRKPPLEFPRVESPAIGYEVMEFHYPRRRRWWHRSTPSSE
jgi:hypothetical protein